MAGLDLAENTLSESHEANPRNSVQKNVRTRRFLCLLDRFPLEVTVGSGGITSDDPPFEVGWPENKGGVIQGRIEDPKSTKIIRASEIISAFRVRSEFSAASSSDGFASSSSLKFFDLIASVLECTTFPSRWPTWWRFSSFDPASATGWAFSMAPFWLAP